LRFVLQHVVGIFYSLVFTQAEINSMARDVLCGNRPVYFNLQLLVRKGKLSRNEQRTDFDMRAALTLLTMGAVLVESSELPADLNAGKTIAYQRVGCKMKSDYEFERTMPWVRVSGFKLEFVSSKHNRQQQPPHPPPQQQQPLHPPPQQPPDLWSPGARSRGYLPPPKVRPASDTGDDDDTNSDTGNGADSDTGDDDDTNSDTGNGADSDTGDDAEPAPANKGPGMLWSDHIEKKRRSEADATTATTLDSNVLLEAFENCIRSVRHKGTDYLALNANTCSGWGVDAEWVATFNELMAEISLGL
jgi:hypothetical protein